jgi:hypothetical protein
LLRLCRRSSRNNYQVDGGEFADGGATASRTPGLGHPAPSCVPFATECAPWTAPVSPGMRACSPGVCPPGPISPGLFSRAYSLAVVSRAYSLAVVSRAYSLASGPSMLEEAKTRRRGTFTAVYSYETAAAIPSALIAAIAGRARPDRPAPHKRSRRSDARRPVR